MKIKDELLKDSNTQEQKIPVKLIQPWSNFIVKFKLPDWGLEDLGKLYNDASDLNVSFGSELVGQVDNEPQVTDELQKKYTRFTNFCMESTRQYVEMSMFQVCAGDNEQKKLKQFQDDEVLTRITTMWFVNQKPNEYNPIHIHTNCKVSAVMYLKKPSQQVIDRKQHYKSDGMITFVNNSGTDISYVNGQCSFNPEPGDMYVFPALQNHMVWPYRSKDPDDSRISLSFNADWILKSALERQSKDQERMYKEMKKMKESENDKGLTDGNINKSG
tara:strand:+ start:625 stop:1443 length:819 start_codon:yes stop_codon:yes gene_type:complete